MHPNALTGSLAREMNADRVRAAERHRLATETRPARAARRTPLALLALLSRLRPARRAVVTLPAPGDA